jgi:predicted transcriptional regulator
MPAERVSMRQIREVLRLRFASELPQRAIAKSLGLSQGAVSSYLSRARAADRRRRDEERPFPLRTKNCEQTQ